MIELVNLFCYPTTGLFERDTPCYLLVGDHPISCFGRNSIFCDWFINPRIFRFFCGIIFCHIKVFLQGKDTSIFNTSIVFLLKFQRTFCFNYSIGRIMLSIKAISSSSKPYFLYSISSVQEWEKSWRGTNANTPLDMF